MCVTEVFFLDIDDVFDIQCELMPIAPLWKNIGQALRLRPRYLHQIQSDQFDASMCLSEVLVGWLRRDYNTGRFGPPSWKLLVAAVAHPAGGNDRALAGEIAFKYNGKCKPEG